jgi:hypothetical protein
MTGGSMKDPPSKLENDKFVTYSTFMEHMLNIEKRLTRLEIIIYLGLAISILSNLVSFFLR